MEGNTAHIFIQVTTGNEEQAWQIARAVVERKLAACAQIFPMRSCYEWEGQVTADSEYMIFIKSHIDRFRALETCIKEIHSYDVPEIIALPIITGWMPYLQWIDQVIGLRAGESGGPK